MNAQRTLPLGTFAAITMAVALTLPACGGGGYSSTPSSPSSSSTSVTTVTLTSSGSSPKQVSISVGQKVRFTNNDSGPHEIRSNPYPTHNGCPPINDVATLAPGQSRDTAALTLDGTCGYHDHLNEGRNTAFEGTILVGTSNPGAPPPAYVQP